MVKKLFRILLSFSLLFLLNFQAEGSIKHTAPRIKVRVANDLTQLKLSGHNLSKRDFSTAKTQKYSGKKSIYFNCRPRKLISKHGPSLLVASLKADSGLIKWNQSEYKGDLLVATNSEYSGCDLINDVSLEDYISSLLAKEMNSKWHLEALKAQAVAARSYAYQKITSQSISHKEKYKLPYDIINSERYQVSGGYHDATDRTIQAAQETRGEILVTKKDEKLVPIFYHADCSGKTFMPDEVWGVHYEGYRPVKCLHPGRKKEYRWNVQVSTMQWLRFIKWYKRVNKISTKQDRIRIFSDKRSRGYLRVYFGKKVNLIPKSHIRRFFGHKKIPSNRFLFKRTGRFYTISGAGRGHGVGMSQIGALYLAKDGLNYRQILNHYYPGFKVKTIY